MEIETKYFGKKKINPEDTIIFPNGLPGFETETHFIVEALSADSPFFVLQSTETPAVAFITAPPFVFFKDYSLELSDEIINQLKIKEEKDVTILAILTINESFELSTANLLAPVIINTKAKLGKQIVLQNTEYKTKEPLPLQQSAAGE